MQNSPTAAYLRDCSFHERLMLASMVKCIKREGVDEIKWREVRQPFLYFRNRPNFLLRAGPKPAFDLYERTSVGYRLPSKTVDERIVHGIGLACCNSCTACRKSEPRKTRRRTKSVAEPRTVRGRESPKRDGRYDVEECVEHVGSVSYYDTIIYHGECEQCNRYATQFAEIIQLQSRSGLLIKGTRHERRRLLYHPGMRS